MESVLLECDDRLLEWLALGGAPSRAQLMDGAATICLGTIYRVTQASSQDQETA